MALRLIISLIFSFSLLATPTANVSPKRPLPDFEKINQESNPARSFALWLPNRILDLSDIFKIDLGLGTSRGAVARFTEYGQIGYRNPEYASLRIGLLGRRIFLLEDELEFGVPWDFQSSNQRKVCKAEVGLGLDLFIAGYGGICFDEALDFITGIFGIDFKNDDLA